MFLKNLFRKKENLEPNHQSQTQIHQKKIPHGHPGNISSADKEKCPFFNKAAQNNSQKDKKNKKKDKEQEQPRGGCPFMNSSDDQKNPGLQIYYQAYDQQYVSKFRYYLSKAKIDLDYFQTKGKRKNRERIIFDQYPIYLQHTLFYNSEDLQKIRTFECCSRFMAYQELRQKGNKKYNKGKYARALDYYERAMSLYKWIEFSEQKNEPVINSTSQMNFKSQTQLSESQFSRSKIQLNLQQNSKQTGKQKLKNQKDQLRTKYKEFFVFYCDQNTKLCDGQEMTETPDIDMRKSLLVQIYLNMAAAYIQLNHFNVALQCCRDAQQLTNKVSQILLRKAQALYLNNSATIKQLNQAKEAIMTAINNKPNEKIYNSTNQNILKMLNLHDADEAYKKCLQNIEKKIEETNKFNLQKKNAVVQRSKQIHQIQQEIIGRGQQPIQRILDKTSKQSSQFKIINRMKDKYLRVIDFYTQSNKKDQVKAAKQQLQQVLRVIHHMNVINNITINDFPEDVVIGERNSEKILKRIQKIKTEHAQNYYNGGKYNFQVLQWAIKQIVDQQFKERQIQKKKKQEQERLLKQQLGVVSQKKNPHLKYLWLLLILPILVIIFTRFIL